ncbi:MBL fold metallo-hydrolase [Synergistales bacterium]|nr:MBL fold metallo-hydrolase [Synergistales bacterium]
MKTYEIIPLKVGEQEPRDKSGATYLQNAGTLKVSPIIAFLVVGNGHTILVDTGCGGEQWSVEKHNFKLHLPPEMEILSAIRAAGVDPGGIDFLVNTHLHHDHCFNDRLFPGKKIYVQKDEIAYAINPHPFQYYYYETAHVGMTPPWIEVMNRFEIVDGDVDLLEGLKLIKFKGHTPGSQGMLVETTGGRYLIAGDVISDFENWEGKGIWKHIPVSIHVNVDDCYRDFDIIEKLDCKVLPGHDQRVFEHKVYPPKS